MLHAGLLEADAALFFPRRQAQAAAAAADGEPLGPCPQCSSDLLLCQRTEGAPYVLCSGVQSCRSSAVLPRLTAQATLAQTTCTVCQHGALRLVSIR